MQIRRRLTRPTTGTTTQNRVEKQATVPVPPTIENEEESEEEIPLVSFLLPLNHQLQLQELQKPLN